jgi:uncharacterized protein YjcR
MKCGAKNRQGKPCQRWSLAGRNRCGLHGGKTPAGPACANYRTGRYSAYVPERLRERYERAEQDVELLSLRGEIALTDARLIDLLARVNTGESGQLWARLKKAHGEFKVCHLARDVPKMNVALAKIEALLDSATQDHAAWAEIGELIEQRRRLAESESKRMVTLEQMMTAEQAMTLAHRVIDIVTRHVTDKQTLRDIVVDMRALTEAASGRSVYEEAPDV